MNRFSLICTLIFITCNLAEASIDSLNNVLAKAKHDTTRIGILTDLVVETVHLADFTKAESYARRAVSLAAKTSFDAYKETGHTAMAIYFRAVQKPDSAYAYIRKAISFQKGHTAIPVKIYTNRIYSFLLKDEGKYDESLAVLANSVSLVSEDKYADNRHKLYGNMGLLYDILGKLDSALVLYDMQGSYYREQGNMEELAAVFQNKGNAYYYQGFYLESINNFIESKKIYSELGDEKFVFQLNANIGALFSNVKQYDKSLEYLRNSVQYADKKGSDTEPAKVYGLIGSTFEAMDLADSALYYHEKAVEINEQTNNQQQLAINYHNIATVYVNIKDTKNAIDYYKKAITIKEKLGLGLSLARSQLGYAQALAAAEKYDQAIRMLETCRPVFEESKANEELMVLYEQLSKIHHATGNFKDAYDYHVLFKQQQDSVLNKAHIEKISELELMYNTSEKDRHIAERDADIALKGRAIAQRNLWIILIVSCAVLGGIIGYIVVVRKRIKAKREEERKINSAIFESEQKERIRIARDLHDSIGQKLSVIKMLMPKSQENTELAKISAFLDETSHEVRTISHNLIPEILNFGFLKALEELSDHINSTEDIQVDLQTDPETRQLILPKQTEVSLYRIVQEITNNIIRHAKANKMHIKIGTTEKILHVDIQDNGIGFTTDSINQSEGLGWKNIFARIRLINGKIKISSNKNTGSHFLIKILTS